MGNTKTIKLSSSDFWIKKSNGIKPFLLLSFIFFSNFIFGQNHEFVYQTWNSSNGLPQNTCHEITQDSKGNIWTVTFNGLVKYNGSNFKTYSSLTNDSITCNRFLRLNIDKEDRIYALSTEGKLLYGKEENLRTIPYPDPSQTPLGAFFNTAGDPLFHIGSQFFTLENDQFKLIEDFVLPEEITLIDVSEYDPLNDRFFVGTIHGLYEVSAKGNEKWEAYDKTPVNGIKAIGDTLIIHSNERTDIWVNDQLLSSHNHAETEHYLGRFAKGKNGEIYEVSTRNFRIYQPNGEVEKFNLKNGFPDFNVKAIFCDQEGNIWLGSNDNGLMKLSPRLFKVISRSDEKYFGGVTCVNNDSDRIWIGGSCNGLHIYNKKTHQITDHIFNLNGFTTNSNFRGECINALYNDGKHFWIGTFGDGLYEFNDSIEHIYKTGNGLKSDAVIAVMDLWKDTLLVATLRGLQLVDKANHTAIADTFFNELDHSRITQLFKDSESNIWIGTFNGVYQIKNREVSKIGVESIIDNNNCRSFYEDEEGAIWIGTYGNGLFRYFNGKIDQITSKNGLHDNVVSTIIRDGDRIWMTCNNGLYAASISEARDFLDGKKDNIRCLSFGIDAGLNKDEFNGGGQLSGFIDKNGSLYLPSIDGMVIFDTKAIPNIQPSNIFISSINIDGKSHKVNEKLMVAQEDKRIIFESSCPVFSYPENMIREYRLIGFDTNWNVINENGNIEFTQLAPGDYKLELRVTSLMDNSPKFSYGEYSFKVDWPWYKKPTYIVIISLGIIGVLLISFVSFHIQNGIRNRRFETELKRRTKQLSEREAQLKTIIENTDQLIFSLDKNLNLVTFNQPFKQFADAQFGFDAKVGAPVFHGAKQKTADFWDPKIKRVFSGEIVHVQVESFIEDQFIVMETTIYPIFNDNSKVTGCVGFSKNITKSIKREAELREAKNQAEEAARSKAEFLATMSHEIRTPLNGVIGMTSLLMNEELTENQKELLKVISLSSETLMNIINEILDFSKIESGKIEIEKAPFEIKQAVNDSASLIRSKAQEKQVDLRITFDQNLPQYVSGDVVRLRQVLINLMNNAVKFTESGYIHIDLKLIEKSSKQSEIEFTVTDTGIGIKEEKLKDLFQPFKQLDSSTTRKYGGTGLGLVICKRFIEIMKGDIWVDSTFGEGTSFHFKIPFENVTPQQIAEISNPTQIQQESEKPSNSVSILVAEDNLINQKLIGLILSKINIIPDIASNGAEAVEMLKQKDYNLLFMDIQMPELDGFEATKLIRKEFEPEHQPVIIAMTANALEGDRERCLEAGMDDYITKPITLQVVKDCIEKWSK